jgi:hypothetical protein
MDHQVVVLTEDEVFGRMLELEFSNLAISTIRTDRLSPDDQAEIVILDLDSAAVPSSDQYRKMIGFSRRPAMTTQGARSCSMILRRPFQMSLLRREVLSELEQRNPAERRDREVQSPAKRKIRLNEEKRLLLCDGKQISLTAKESALIKCLLERRGEALSRDFLAEMLGAQDPSEVNVYVCYLRRKTDDLPGGRIISTVRGKGYQIR